MNSAATARHVAGRLHAPAQSTHSPDGSRRIDRPIAQDVDATASDRRLIDWNRAAPDGTPAALNNLLTAFATHFHATALMAFELHGTLSETFSSEPTIKQASHTHLESSAVLEATRAQASCLYAAEGGNNSGVLQNLRDQRSCALVLGIGAGESPRPSELMRIGLVLCVGQRQHIQSTEAYSRDISQLRKELPSWLEVWQSCHAGRKLHKRRARWHSLRGRRGRIIAAGALILAAACFIPIPYRPQRECVVEPAARSFVASPIDGRLVHASVRPGDTVHTGQSLATLDDQELLWKFSSAEAEYDAAAKKRDTALATRNGGELRLAQLEQERIALEIDSLSDQLGRLELRSPMDGIVVQGDWYQSQGAPVSRGDTVFEIAPLETMRIETRLSTEDLAHIPVGSSTSVRVDAAAGVSWQAAIQRIDTRGQLLDDEVVFVADSELENKQRLLRPGMRGTVRISAGSKSIGWILFHRPYLWIMKQLAW